MMNPTLHFGLIDDVMHFAIEKRSFRKGLRSYNRHTHTLITRLYTYCNKKTKGTAGHFLVG